MQLIIESNPARNLLNCSCEALCQLFVSSLCNHPSVTAPDIAPQKVIEAPKPQTLIPPNLAPLNLGP